MFTNIVKIKSQTMQTESIKAFILDQLGLEPSSPPVRLDGVDKAVENLWKTCGQTCGQLGHLTSLWIAVDKSGVYPQDKPIYPQNYPHGVYRPGARNYHISTVSTGPTIYRRFSLNLFRFASLVE